MSLQKSSLRIVFMGTPEFAVGTLRALVENHYPVVGVVTQPDRPVGRHGNTLRPSPVKEYALRHGIPVMQPEKMKDESFLEQLRQLQPNLQVVVAFRMLPEVVWGLPQYGTFNVHASLLPKYRGAAPINWAIINGEEQTGVTTFFLDHDIDTGRIILQQPLPIPPEANVETMYERLMDEGARLALRTIDLMMTSNGNPPTQLQSETECADRPLPTAPKIFKETCRIDWYQTARHVYNFIRGLSPMPGAWTTMAQDGKECNTLKIYNARVMDEDFGLETGTMAIESGRLFATCGEGTIEIQELQLAGKRRMTAKDFINGMHHADHFRLM